MTKSNNSSMLFTEPIDMIIIGYLIEKTKIDCDELGYDFEQFKKALSVKIALYIDENFDKKKEE